MVGWSVLIGNWQDISYCSMRLAALTRVQRLPQQDSPVRALLG
jgi:hypothetical protein